MKYRIMESKALHFAFDYSVNHDFVLSEFRAGPTRRASPVVMILPSMILPVPILQNHEWQNDGEFRSPPVI